jgi:hypothetical protein
MPYNGGEAQLADIDPARLVSRRALRYRANSPMFWPHSTLESESSAHAGLPKVSELVNER